MSSSSVLLKGLGLVDVIGTASGETLVGGNEQITWGGAGNDRLDGSNHDDTLYGDEGPADYLIGGNGIDSGEDADGARLKSVENFDGKEITDKSDKSKKPKKSQK